MNIQGTLNTITKTDFLHAQWLNSLSYLEYRGFRKIARSRSTDQMSFEVLLHTAEEVRHAVFFKRQALKLGGDQFNVFSRKTLLCDWALKKYFYEIDSQTVSAIAGIETSVLQDAAYFLVTWLVETRATSLYQEYERILNAGRFHFSLSGILREETAHLMALGEAAQRTLREQGFDPKRILQIEMTEFTNLWNEIEAEVVL